VPGGVQSAFGVFGRLHQGHHYSCRAQVEGAADASEFDRLHPHQARHPVASHHREQGAVDPAQVDTVLSVDDDEIGVGRGSAVDHRLIASHRPEAVNDPLVAEGVCA
jgi:hypothetical protein